MPPLRRLQTLKEFSAQRGSATCGEESLELRRALFGEHAAKYVHTMIEAGQREHIDDTAGCARAPIPRAEHKAAHARVHDGGGAHDARLERHIERGVVEAVVVKRTARGTQSRNLRMCSRIMRRNGAI